jgi:hypothetical protein
MADLAAHHIDQLRRSCGEVITPADATYDDARRLWNAIHDRRPAVIVRPTSAQMVAAAVQFAREHGLEIVVRSGGHSAAGSKGADGSLLIDLSGMRGVEVDPATRIVRSNGGALLGDPGASRPDGTQRLALTTVDHCGMLPVVHGVHNGEPDDCR